MSSHPTPPKLARRILLFLTRGDPRLELVRELDIEYWERRETGSWLGANMWYWREAFTLDGLRLRRELGPTPPDRSTGESDRRWVRQIRAAVDALRYDVRTAIRALRREPGHTATVIVMLALGIGANTAIFSVLHAVLLEPLPYPDPEQLVFVWVQTSDNPQTRFSGPGSADFVDQAQAYSNVARIFGAGRTTVNFGSGPEEIIGQGVSPGAFEVYGVTPVLGRSFTSEDLVTLSVSQMRDRELRRPLGAMVISHELWVSRFGGDSTVVGRIVSHGGHARMIVGVQAPGFLMHRPAADGGAAGADMWYLPYWDQSLFPRTGDFVGMVARMATGVTHEQAQADADAFAQRQRELYPEQRNRDYRLRVAPLHEGVVRDARMPLLLLFGAVGFVLCIACANVANLSLARALSRERELMLRASVGASARRLIRQSLTESAVLSLLGAGFGLLLAIWGVSALPHIGSAEMPRTLNVSVDTPILLFALGTAVLATMLAGFVPALRAGQIEPADVLKTRGPSTHRHQFRFRSALVIGQVALAVPLVVGTGLLLRSLSGLTDVNPGFEPEDVLTAQVTATSQHYPTPVSRLAFFHDLQQRFGGLPGVEAVGFAQPLPFYGLQVTSVGVRETDGTVTEHWSGLRQWSAGTFEALGMELLAGRFFDTGDFTDVNRFAVVVDDRFAARAWPDGQALGQQVRVHRREYGADDEIWMEPYWAEVVGVVRRIRGSALNEDDLETVFVTFHQNPWASGQFVLRTSADPASTFSALRTTLREVNPDILLSREGVLGTTVRQTLGSLRFISSLIGLFGAMSLILAIVGIYGAVAYAVKQRTPELGTRLALGAVRQDILRLVIGGVLRLLVAGVALGLIGALGLSRFLQSQLFAVEPWDPATLAVVSTLLIAVGAFAGYAPARRASRLDPVQTLKAE